MFKGTTGQGERRPSGSSAQGARISRNLVYVRIAAVLAGMILLTQPACLFRKHKTAAPKVLPSSVRIAYLPLNIPSENTELRWLSLAVPIMMAKVSESAPDLEPVPLWETMPVAAEAAGSSRNITAEVAAYIASRLTAKWAAEGELSPTKGGVHMTVDFIPAKTTLVPFRFEKEGSIDSLGASFQNATEQLLRYLVLRPMSKSDKDSVNTKSMKEVAEALDREYGWFVTANPGKSDKVVANLARTDSRLARLLFNPSLYPSMATPPPAPKASKPAAPSTTAKSNANPPQPAPQAQPLVSVPSTPSNSIDAERGPHPAPPAPNEAAALPKPIPEPDIQKSPSQTVSSAQPAPAVAFVPPPPRSFSQKLDSTALSVGPEGNVSVAKDQHSTAPQAMNKASPATRLANFKIQVGSSRSKEGAEAFAARLTKAGLSSETEMLDLKEKGVWYRVRLQGFESRKAADASGQKLLAAGLIKAYWLVP